MYLKLKKPNLPVLVILVAVFVWLGSGLIDRPEKVPAPSIAQFNDIQSNSRDDTLTRVRARYISASPQVEEVVIKGQTLANRKLEVKAETTGRVVRVPVERGDRVARRDPLCLISINSRQVKVDEAKAALAEAELEYKSIEELKARGLQSEMSAMSSKAKLFSRRAELKQRKLDLERTSVVAPFDGIAEEVFAEVGTYMQTGNVCAEIVDLDPILITGNVSEMNVGLLAVGQTAYITLLDNRTIEGRVTFVSKAAGSLSRTYQIEIEAINSDLAIASGLTAQVKIPVKQRPAHLVSPALLGLNDFGEIGLRILDADNRVIFQPVEILKDSSEGVWVTGLPTTAKVITLGQELVSAGEVVEVVLEGVGSAASTDDNRQNSRPAPDGLVRGRRAG